MTTASILSRVTRLEAAIAALTGQQTVPAAVALMEMALER
jgi:hypothetical protein